MSYIFISSETGAVRVWWGLFEGGKSRGLCHRSVVSRPALV